MKTPKKFSVIYKSLECDEEYEIENALFERMYIFCDDCDCTHPFVSVKLIHKSWEWDQIENELDELNIQDLPGFSYELQT